MEYIAVTDRDGRRLYEGRAEGRREFFDERPTPSLDLPDGTGRRSTETSRDYDIAVPIENIGFVHVGVSKDAVEARLKSLRSDLVRKTAFCGLIAPRGPGGDGRVSLEASRAESEARARASGRSEIPRARRGRGGARARDSKSSSRDRAESPEPAGQLSRRNGEVLSDEVRSEASGPARRRFPGLCAAVAPAARGFLALSFLKETCDLASFESKGRGVDVRCEAVPEGTVRWDSGKIRQVVWNLIRNAVDASTEAAGPAFRKEVVLAALRVDGAVEIRVTDRGEGIPEETLRKIPSLFFTTKKGAAVWASWSLRESSRSTAERCRSRREPARGPRFPFACPRGRRRSPHEGCHGCLCHHDIRRRSLPRGIPIVGPGSAPQRRTHGGRVRLERG